MASNNEKAGIEVVNPAILPEPKGYSHGIQARGGSVLFVAGQIGWDRECRIVSDTFSEQFGQALENVIKVVNKAGGLPENITRLQIFVTDKTEYQAQLKAVGTVYRSIMGRHYPAMTLVEVSSLLEPLAKVEIEATAVI